MKGAPSQVLDLVRGVAALLVLVNHARALMLAPYGEGGGGGPVAKALYFFTGFGHQSVVLFFVLSGFFISRSVIKGIQEARFSLASYAIDRVCRLGIVLVPALLLGLFWDRLGMALWGSTGVYAGLALNAHILPFSVAERSNWPVMLGNLFFLQELVVPPFGSNSPMWSLSYEFWYYVAFPLLMGALLGARKLLNAALFAALAGAVVFLNGTVALYFLVWLMGLLPLFLPQVAKDWKPRARQALFAICALLFAGALVAARFSLLKSALLEDGLLGITFSLAIWALLQLGLRPSQGAFQALSKTLSGFSYTLYLVHMPLLVFLQAALLKLHGTRLASDLKGMGLYALVTLGVALYAWGLSRVTEAHTATVRAFFSKKFLPQGAPDVSRS